MRRAQTRLTVHRDSVLLLDYQVPGLRQEPLPCVEHARLTVPFACFAIVNELPDFDDAVTVYRSLLGDETVTWPDNEPRFRPVLPSCVEVVQLVKDSTGSA